MAVNPIDSVELSTDGRRYGEYGRTDGGSLVFVWYHDGLYSYNEPAWAMGGMEEARIDDRVETILVSHFGTVYAIDREAFGRAYGVLDGIDQLIATASDDFVSRIGRAKDIFNKHLDMAHIDDGYHKRANH